MSEGGMGELGELRDLQIAFAGLASRPARIAEDDAGVQALAAPGKRTPAAQIEAYREQFWLRHVGSLREDYTALERLLGAEEFEELARAYFGSMPPAVWALRDTSADLPGFVAKTLPFGERPAAVDLAAVEWACIEVVDAPDAPLLDPEAFARVPEDAWGTARIRLHPALRILTLSTPAHRLRESLRSEVREIGKAPEVTAPGLHVVYYRPVRTEGGASIGWREIPGDAAVVLRELARGTPLGEACERVAHPDGADPAVFEAELGSWFASWTADGWIVGVDLPDRLPS